MNCPVADDGIRGKNEKYGENPKLVQVVDLLRSGNEPLNRDKDKASDSRRIHTHSSVSKPIRGSRHEKPIRIKKRYMRRHKKNIDTNTISERLPGESSLPLPTVSGGGDDAGVFYRIFQIFVTD